MTKPIKKFAEITHEEREEISNLLAVIHGDGGDYESKHGLLKATVDAQWKVFELFSHLDNKGV